MYGNDLNRISFRLTKNNELNGLIIGLMYARGYLSGAGYQS